MSQRIAHEGGFTLIEVMVSLMIFLVASMGLLPLLVTNLQANQNNLLHGQARRLASETMAILQASDYATLPMVSTTPFLSGDIELTQEITPDTPTGGQTSLTVTARWQRRGQQHRYQLQSIRTAP
jgi:prepilin-type N-terminal cleavage/methylation domain-containing protein